MPYDIEQLWDAIVGVVERSLASRSPELMFCFLLLVNSCFGIASALSIDKATMEAASPAAQLPERAALLARPPAAGRPPAGTSRAPRAPSSARRHAPPVRAAIAPCSSTLPAREPAHPSDAPPATFRRLVARRTGASFREVAEVEEEAMPVPGEGEVLVRVAYAGVNGGCETFRARGEHAFVRNAGAPWFALGAEGAGEVVAAGPGVPAHLAPGQHVTFVGGAFSEYVVAKATLCWPVPAATPEAVALTISATVAAAALGAVGRARRGETVLVTAAGGATGSFAAQLARLAGCRVVATCGGELKAARLRGLGLDRVIDHTQEARAHQTTDPFGVSWTRPHALAP
jgi:hypothetical protein